jgi:hypothetical protein
MFTDWSMTDPHYFYRHGAMFGFVFATLLWLYFVPFTRKWLKRKDKRCQRNA